MKLSEQILGIVFAFPDAERRDAIRSISEAVTELEKFVKTCRDDFDCNQDAHKYKTFCPACEAKKLIPE